jgi:hypothetical protein
MSNYMGVLDTVPLCSKDSTTCVDSANRLGELKARVGTIRHVFNDRLLPSIPGYGFRYPSYEGLPPAP